jgi:hypothetical protein
VAKATRKKSATRKKAVAKKASTSKKKTSPKRRRQARKSKKKTGGFFVGEIVPLIRSNAAIPHQKVGFTMLGITTLPDSASVTIGGQTDNNPRMKIIGGHLAVIAGDFDHGNPDRGHPFEEGVTAVTVTTTTGGVPTTHPEGKVGGGEIP